MDSAHNEFASVADVIAGTPRVAYSKDVPGLTIQPAEIVTAPIGGAATTVAAAADGFHARELAISALEAGSDQRAGVVAWVSDTGDKPGVFLRFIDKQGKPNGATQTLTSALGAASSVALTSGPDGGAVIYTVASGGTQQIRYRSLAAGDGSLGDEVELTSINQDVGDLAIAAYSVGYVVAYRHLGGGSDSGSIQLLFVDRYGKLGRSRLVASATSSGKGLRVLVAQDGRIIVAWADTQTVTPDGGVPGVAYRVAAARLLCP
jgi:hypothetical protein